MITYEIEVTINPIRTMLGGACISVEAVVLASTSDPDLGLKPKYAHLTAMKLGEVTVEKPLTDDQVNSMEKPERYRDMFPGIEGVKLKRKEVAVEPPASVVRAEK